MRKCAFIPSFHDILQVANYVTAVKLGPFILLCFVGKTLQSERGSFVLATFLLCLALSLLLTGHW